MVGIPLYPDYRESLHDFIIPEIPQDSDASVELNFVNPNYNTSYYDVTHYATDGTVMKTVGNQSLAGAYREAKQVSDFVASSILGRGASRWRLRLRAKPAMRLPRISSPVRAVLSSHKRDSENAPLRAHFNTAAE